jgi:(p)ppGpp synthase/HD superfamily hydrolase
MDYLEPCQYSTRLIEKLKSLDTENILDFKLIDKAIYWAKKYHNGQFRKSGEPYYTHPLEVAYLVSEYKLTTNVIVTAILHDVVEDSEATVGMIVDAFSWRIAEMVDKLTTDNLEEIYNVFCEDNEVALIKLMDRKHNLSTINFMPRNKAINKIQDSYKSHFLGAAAEVSKELETEFSKLLEKEDKHFIADEYYLGSFQIPKIIF